MWTAEWNEIVFTNESRFCLQRHYARIRVWRHRGERMLNSCVMHRHTDLAPGVMGGGIGYHSRTPLVRIAGTSNSQRYISEVLEPVVLPYLQSLPTAIFQQDNARPHVSRIVQAFFVNRQIELLPWPARFPDLSPTENMWSMVAERLTQITSQAATPDQLWQRVEAAWSAVPQEHIQSLFESMPRRVAAVCEFHFSPCDIEKKTYMYLEETGETLSAPLKIPRLRKDAIPTKLLGAPSYLCTDVSIRVSAEERQTIREKRQLQMAISKSIMSKKSEDSK
ncbi:Transposable element Tcb1 transposase, partial [Stegodyphus mimosarum]